MSKPNIVRSASCALLIVSAAAGCSEAGPREPEPDSGLDAAVDRASATSDARTGLHDADAAVIRLVDASTADASTGPSTASLADGGTPNTDYGAWLLRVDKLRGCGVVGDGAYPFFLPFHQRCESLCIVAASCEELRGDACEQAAAASLEACFDACSEDVVSCGDGQKVPSDAACDLASDCNNGEDEAHCEVFTCVADGKKVGGYYRCDGEEHCADGSDELGCASVCGQTIANSI